mgnify:CR=1 FL=1
MTKQAEEILERKRFMIKDGSEWVSWAGAKDAMQEYADLVLEDRDFHDWLFDNDSYYVPFINNHIRLYKTPNNTIYTKDELFDYWKKI